MNRQEKQKVIEGMKNDFRQSQASFVVNMKGMTVEAVQGLRRELYAKNGKIKVAKNTLLELATSDLPGVNDLAPFFKDQIAVVFAQTEAPTIAKILFNVAKVQENLKVKAGVLDARLLSLEQLEFLASLPSKEVMLARLCGSLQAPIANYVSILNQLIVRLLWVLKEIEKTKQS